MGGGDQIREVGTAKEEPKIRCSQPTRTAGLGPRTSNN